MTEPAAQDPATGGGPPRAPEANGGGAPPQQAKDPPVPELAGRAEQVGAIIVKTLDLAEAGLSLGITVLTRAGAAAQGAIVERVPSGPGAGAVSAQPPGPPPAGYHEQPAPEPAPSQAAPEEAFFLANRVPLAPGGEVKVSFSITNDSLLEPKKVALRVEPLFGEQHGVRLDAGAFAVRPGRKTIPPMDFEKFVLTGTLPAAAPPDIYLGAVIVQSTDEMSIPVRLLVAVP